MNNRYIPSLIFLAVFLCFLLTACGNSAKSEKEVAIELSQIDSYFTSYSLELNSFSVEKRQTNIDEKTDYIWLNICGRNDNFEYTANYLVEYVLYNDGWLLESYDLLDSQYCVLADFDRTELENTFSHDYTDYEYISSHQEENTVELVYKVTRTEEYTVCTYNMNIAFRYTPQNSWTEESRKMDLIDSEVDLVLAGQHYIDKGNFSAAINYLSEIKNPTPENTKLLNDTYEKCIDEMYTSQGYGSIYTFEKIREYISNMPQKTARVALIEENIGLFVSEYGKWVGEWGKDGYDPDSFEPYGSIKIYPKYNEDTDGLILEIADAYRFEKYTICSVEEISDSAICYHALTEYREIVYVNDSEISYKWTTEDFSTEATQSSTLYKFDLS